MCEGGGEEREGRKMIGWIRQIWQRAGIKKDSHKYIETRKIDTAITQNNHQSFSEVNNDSYCYSSIGLRVLRTTGFIKESAILLAILWIHYNFQSTCGNYTVSMKLIWYVLITIKLYYMYFLAHLIRRLE